MATCSRLARLARSGLSAVGDVSGLKERLGLGLRASIRCAGPKNRHGDNLRSAARLAGVVATSDDGN